MSGHEIAADVVRMLEGQRDRYRQALAELVRLKDGPRDEAYERDKPVAWQAAREVLNTSPSADTRSAREQ